MREDLIDFPVSDAWRDYYYEMGLTRFPSPRYHERRDEEIRALRQELARLNDILTQLLSRKTKAKKPARKVERRRKTWPIDTE